MGDKSCAPGTADSTRIHSYILDSACHFIAEYRSSAPASGESLPAVWDMTDAEGKVLPTGEYYVNFVRGYGCWTDTTNWKIGWVKNP
jgi:hypothetical protein